MYELPTILDIEASGFGRGSYPIEVGFIQPDGSTFCSLIRPQPEWQQWDEQAEALHGISREVLLRHGRPLEWVARQINTRLAGQTVYCDAWGHDYPWMARLFDSADMSPSFRIADLRNLLSESDAIHWQAAVEQVRSELKLDRHRASSDARVLQLALQRVKGLARTA